MNQTYTFTLGNKRYDKVSKHDMNVAIAKEAKNIYEEANK
ncbi:hypothetical protein MUDAN_DOGOELCO_02537 [Lactiplantibacillus mudanjiangensis]|nr:hypothetical protein MUDAN_DOGOELCO_02537 [Lactiplantibacillus mudanjiangensis]